MHREEIEIKCHEKIKLGLTLLKSILTMYLNFETLNPIVDGWNQGTSVWKGCTSIKAIEQSIVKLIIDDFYTSKFLSFLAYYRQ